MNDLLHIYERLGYLHEYPDKAARYYRQFIDPWRDSDPELQPQVAEASRHLAALRSMGAPAGSANRQMSR